MRIVCLAWGSLVWSPRELPHTPPWLTDGPMAPVEFSRQAFDGRITLVLDPEAAPIRLHWAEMPVDDLALACSALAAREGIPAHLADRHVGRWRSGEAAPELIPDLPDWAMRNRIAAAVWTALPSQFAGDGADRPTPGRPSIDWVIDYLRDLTGPLRDRAEEYIRSAPLQTDTHYRRRIAAELGWHPGERR